MKPHLLIAVAALLVWPSAQALAEDAQVKTLGFCELMSNPMLYSRRVVRVRAIFAQGAEQSVLYDPDCGNGKASAAVEFGPRCKGATKKLDRLVAKGRRAWVVVEGLFYGPEPAKIDPGLPDSLKQKLKGSPQRYGHQGAFETMIQVTKVVSADQVSPDVPW
jgi:hypothetical protein